MTWLMGSNPVVSPAWPWNPLGSIGPLPSRSFWHGWDRFLTSQLSNREPKDRMLLKT
jgi:hypothetical protein